MKAAVLVNPGEVHIDEAPVPVPAANEVLVRLEGCGVCASNLPPWEGRPWFNYPMAPGQLGHEGWGCVVERGRDVQDVSVGQRVAMLSQHAYAQYDVVAVDKLLPLPDVLEDVPFPGEPLGCAFNIFERSGIEPGQTVAIVGIGFLGALLTRLASRAGARVLAISRRPFSLGVAGRMGAAQAIVMDDHWRIIDEVREATQGKLCPVVIEATGKQWPLDLSAELTAERGRLVVAGYHQDGPRQVNLQMWNWKGLDVINAHERLDATYVHGMRSAIQAAARGELDFQPLLTHRYALGELGQALAATRDRPDGFLKAVILM